MLVCGGRVKDLFGVKYYIVCGVLDIVGVNKRMVLCFKYGIKKVKVIDKKVVDNKKK